MMKLKSDKKQLTKLQFDELKIWWKCKLIIRHVDKIRMLTKMADWKNKKLTKMQVDETESCQNWQWLKL